MAWNWAHIHLILNPIPAVGLPLGLILIAAIIFSRDHLLAKVTRIYFFIVTVMTVFVFFSGHQAENVVEPLTRVPWGAVHYHESLATTAFWFILALGLWLTVSGFLRERTTMKLNREWEVMFVAIILLSGLVAVVGSRGGKITHTEIRDVDYEAKLQAHGDGHEHGREREPDNSEEGTGAGANQMEEPKDRAQ